jgi:rRNA maturation endonuclease Nob1
MEHKPLDACPRCASTLLQFDAQFVADAHRFGVLGQVPYMYHCYGCHHTVYSYIPSTVPDPPDDKVCANCGDLLEKGRRRYCSERCARPTKLEQERIDREKAKRHRG